MWLACAGHLTEGTHMCGPNEQMQMAWKTNPAMLEVPGQEGRGCKDCAKSPLLLMYLGSNLRGFTRSREKSKECSLPCSSHD